MVKPLAQGKKIKKNQNETGLDIIKLVRDT